MQANNVKLECQVCWKPLTVTVTGVWHTWLWTGFKDNGKRRTTHKNDTDAVNERQYESVYMLQVIIIFTQVKGINV